MTKPRSIDEILDSLRHRGMYDYGNDQAKQALKQLLLSEMPKKSNLAYRQGRELPVITGIEQKDPDHVKAKKYIGYGRNQALKEVQETIERIMG